MCCKVYVHEEPDDNYKNYATKHVKIVHCTLANITLLQNGNIRTAFGVDHGCHCVCVSLCVCVFVCLCVRFVVAVLFVLFL